MTTVVSRDDWRLFVACLALALGFVVFGPLAIPFIGLLFMVYFFKDEIRAGYESAMESDSDADLESTD
ncbi:hypothetical protein [Halomicrococcus sp. SG-WS-1]|uniref:hypothetical protein n=1 Tax=Halomicrococcus sp. SG-WS-1 TaxID=3439057 RepID=UPI003F7A24D6